MRSEFEARVRPARDGSPHRCVWDYWYVEDQYAYLRCLARGFFSPALYRAFMARLRSWGEEHLGCTTCTELWLSYYVEGCRQELHADVGHGPWAVVFSLTQWGQRRFRGGETTLLKARVMDYWHDFDPTQPLEHAQITDRFPPLFNQLLVFDGRIPHAVRAIEGTRDPVDSRVVLHGWFRTPTPIASGALGLADTEPVATELCNTWNRRREHLGRMNGILPVRLDITADGRVSRVTSLAETLISLDGRPLAPAESIALASDICRNAQFAAPRGRGTLLLPFIAADR